MTQKYSQELVDEIKDMVADRMAELRAMNRETLSAEYLRVVGVEAHPRWHLDMMVKMIARFYQGDLWNEKTGDIPVSIRERDMKFWLSEEAYFVSKPALKEEQAQPVTAKARKKKQPLGPQGLPGSRGTGLQSKARNLEDATLVLERAPKTQDADILAAEQIIQKAPDNRLEYSVFAQYCKKKKLNKPPHMLALLMKREGIIDLLYPEEPEAPPPPPPPQEEEEEGMTFTEVLEGVEESKQRLVVEPVCVDFGTDEKVSDYD